MEGEYSNSQKSGRNVYQEVTIMWKNKERSVDWGGVFGLSIIKHVTSQKIVAHDFQYECKGMGQDSSGPCTAASKIYYAFPSYSSLCQSYTCDEKQDVP
jgi:hypothetical protein